MGALCCAVLHDHSKSKVIVNAEGLQLKMQERECEQSETDCENN